jgi:putative phosphoesterase
MLFGICSDSHDHVEHINKAADVFRRNNVDKVIHAGDYCSPFTIPLFDGLPLHGIFGNNDGDKYLLMKKFDEIGAVLHGDFFAFEVEKLKIAVYHGTYPEITESLEICGKYDVVISGHTHQPRLDTVEKTLAINPGSINGFDQDAMVALFNSETRQVRFIEL